MNAGSRTRASLAAAVVAILLGAFVAVTPADPAAAEPPHLQGQRGTVDDVGGEVKGTRAWPYTPQKAVALPEPVWPKPGRVSVAVPAKGARVAAARAGDLPVSVSAPTTEAATAVSSVDVEVIDRAKVPAGWRDGVVVKLGVPSAGARGGATRLAVDYSDFRWAYGAEWASRLKLYQLPACALSTPGKAGCDATPVPSVNDSAAAQVTADVPLAAAGQTVFALAAAPAGPGGDFSATPLSASATWTSGRSTGDFVWSYGMRTPPAIAGAAPKLSLSYGSASVDGRNEVSNNQPSWLGEGFDYAPGFIERRYVPCAEDMEGTHNNTEKTGDLCWRSDNATLSLGGSGGELIFETGKGWHSRSEDGSKIEKLTGGGNGANDGEYWKVTTSDGTQYFFGRHSLPGQTAKTDSTWTVPVAGNNSGEPCRATAFKDSFCDQAWRWNLDYVVDVRGNTTSYWYAKETNKYARNITDTDDVSYVRGGMLTRIDYGTWDRADSRSTTARAQIEFTPANRCVTNFCGTHNATNWPDTPWDQECTGSSCEGDYSPTFWSTQRLAKITTRVWDTTKPAPAVPDWQDVDSWTFTHSFPSAGDGSLHSGMWLEKIQHTGLVGGSVSEPPVTFTPESLPNRVLTENLSSVNWQRIDYIVTETGAKIDVTWKLPDCKANDLPSSPETNTRRCYPVRVPDPADPTGKRLVNQWWHKHIIESVSESDLPQDPAQHQAPPVFSYYNYVGTPAWHYADDDGLTKPDRKTWSQFRGYAKVETRVGDVPGLQTLKVTTYLRGMHGDRLNASGGSRTVTSSATLGTEVINDEDQYAGIPREEVVYNGTTSKPVSKTVNVPWMSSPKASRTINGDTVTARFVNTRVSYSATALGVDGSRGWRTTRTENWFSDDYGTIDKAQDDGLFQVPGDEQCSAHTYNRNLTKNLLETVAQTTTTALPCGTAPTAAAHIVDDTRTYYDGATSLTTAPTYGAVTKVERLGNWTAAAGTTWSPQSEATFDLFGRSTSTKDPKGNLINTAYAPTDLLTTKVTTTRPAPLNWVNSVETSPYWGLPTRTTDQNNLVNEARYDELGRVFRVWTAGWNRAGREESPSREFTYTYAPDRSAYPFTTVRTLNAAGSYVTAYQIKDSLLRPRQTQRPAVGGGRVVEDTLYDKLGRANVNYGAHLEPGDPSGVLWSEPEWSVPAVAKTVYDNAGRATDSIFLAPEGTTNQVEQWRTVTAYEGDLTKVTPPDGGTPTSTVVDVQGRAVELRQHTTAGGVAGDYQSTFYSYNPKDQLTEVKDSAGNRWTFTYDVRGRQTEAVDPDKGRTTNEYNAYDELEKTTDGKGAVLWSVYDTLGRRTELRENSATGPLRAAWKFDKLYSGSALYAKGQETEQWRYEPAGSSNIYKIQVATFNPRGLTASVNYVIPPVEGTGLSGTKTVGYGYSPYDGTPATITYPAGGGLTTETVTTNFDEVTGLPRSLDTNAIGVGGYVGRQSYTEFGEPSVTQRKIAGGVYVDEATEYDESTRRVKRTQIQPETATGIVSDRNFDYDDAGNITSIADKPVVGAVDTQCFDQDYLLRLASAWTPKVGVDCKAAPTVSNLGGPAPYWLDWTFDAVGNRKTETSHTSGGDTQRIYDFPTGGAGVVRPHAVTQVTTKAPGQTEVLTRYGYDGAGNTVCRPTGTATNVCPPGTNSQLLNWDAEGRLAEVRVGASQAQSNVYAPDGSRLIRRDPTGTTLYLPGQEIRRDASGSLTGTRYYSIGGKTVACRTPASLTWVFSDHQGTQHTVVDAHTQTVTVRRQLPYGGARGVTPAWPNQKGFVGGDVDPVNLTQVGARQYDSTLGRFISVDPLMPMDDPQSWHGYSYANNSPVTSSDPTGLSPDTSTDGGSPPTPGEQANMYCDYAEVKTGCYDDYMDTYYPDLREWVAHKADFERSTRNFADITSVAPPINIFVTGIELVLCAQDPTLECAVETSLNMVPGRRAGRLGKHALDGADEATASKKLAKESDGGTCQSPGPHSFDPETLVLMADGTTKKIGEIEEGDAVAATDPETGRTEPRRVTKLHRNEDTDLTDVTVLTEDGEVDIQTTDHHPFWDPADQKWVDAADLAPGDQLSALSGASVRVTAVRSFAGDKVMNDLTVDDVHTYHVLLGDEAVLVHNDSTVGVCPVNPKSKHGPMGELASLRRLESEGYTNIHPQVEFVNSAGDTFRADFIARGADGKWIAVEAKVERRKGNATLSPAQQLGYKEIESVGVVVKNSTLKSEGLPKGAIVNMKVVYDIWTCPQCAP